jgi:hypothetical protein
MGQGGPPLTCDPNAVDKQLQDALHNNGFAIPGGTITSICCKSPSYCQCGAFECVQTSTYCECGWAGYQVGEPTASCTGKTGTVCCAGVNPNFGDGESGTCVCDNNSTGCSPGTTQVPSCDVSTTPRCGTPGGEVDSCS